MWTMGVMYMFETTLSGHSSASIPTTFQAFPSASSTRCSETCTVQALTEVGACEIVTEF